jgi:hypothetical protein
MKSRRRVNRYAAHLDGGFDMNWSHDQALTHLRTWQSAKDRPTLIIELAISYLAQLTAIGEIVNVSDEELVLAFGRVAWGSGQITLPLRTANFTYVTPTDKSDNLPAHNNARMVGCLELRYPGNNGGCFIKELKPGTFASIENIGRVVIESRNAAQ